MFVVIKISQIQNTDYSMTSNALYLWNGFLMTCRHPVLNGAHSVHYNLKVTCFPLPIITLQWHRYGIRCLIKKSTHSYATFNSFICCNCAVVALSCTAFSYPFESGRKECVSMLNGTISEQQLNLQHPLVTLSAKWVTVENMKPIPCGGHCALPSKLKWGISWIKKKIEMFSRFKTLISHWGERRSHRMWDISSRKGVFMQPVQSWSIHRGASCCKGVRRG